MLLLSFTVAATLGSVALAAESPVPEARWSYRGSGPAGELTAREIAERVGADPSAEHWVLDAASGSWKPWNQVPEIARAYMARAGTTAPSPAEPAPTPIVVPPPAARHDLVLPPPERMLVLVHGEARAILSMTELGDGSGRSTFAHVGAQVPRAVLRADAHLGPAVAARVAVGRYDGPLGSEWLPEAWVAWRGGTSVHTEVRAGRQYTIFGVVERIDGLGSWTMPGQTGDLDVSSGMVPPHVDGLAGRVAGETWELEVQADSTPPGSIAPEPSATARASYAPADWITITGSGLYGARGPDLERWVGQGAGAIVIETSRARVLAEVAGGRDNESGTEVGFAGFLVAGGVDLPVEASSLQSLAACVRGGGFDPAISGAGPGTDFPDANWHAGAGLQATWDLPVDSVATAGLGYRLDVPQNVQIPLTHAVSAEAGFRF